MCQALRGEDLTVFGDGSQTRSFCYVADLIDGIYRLMTSDVAGPGEHRQPGRDDDPRVRAARSSRSRGRRARSSTSRCRSTTRRCASPTSRRRGSCSAGSRRWRSRKAWPRRSRTSASGSAEPAERTAFRAPFDDRRVQGRLLSSRCPHGAGLRRNSWRARKPDRRCPCAESSDARPASTPVVGAILEGLKRPRVPRL